jgi:outer membrane immunogenic protein
MQRNFTAYLASAAIILGASTTAQAADIPVVRKAPAAVIAHNWTGFYVGAHAGYGWGRSTWTDVAGLVVDDNTRHNLRGGLAGAQLGYNVQHGMWVFGIEGDWSWTGISGSSLFDGVDPVETDVRWLATVTGRIGIAHGAWLPYIRGGVAWANERFTISIPAVPRTTETTDTRTGWTLGAGLEYAFTRNWSARIGYDYISLGTARANSGFAGFPLDIKHHLHVAKLAVNYRFGP